MKPDARAINGEYGRGRRSLARARGRSPDRLKPLRDLYEGQSVRAHRFRYGLLAFDLVTVAFIVVTSFLPRGPVVETLDVGFSNRPFGVKRFQTIHQHSVDVASLIGRLESSAFRLSTSTVSMSLTGSCFSSELAPRPFHHGIRRRGGTIFGTALPSV